jgi:hypothetical protein
MNEGPSKDEEIEIPERNKVEIEDQSLEINQ